MLPIGIFWVSGYSLQIPILIHLNLWVPSISSARRKKCWRWKVAKIAVHKTTSYNFWGPKNSCAPERPHMEVQSWWAVLGRFGRPQDFLHWSCPTRSQKVRTRELRVDVCRMVVGFTNLSAVIFYVYMRLLNFTCKKISSNHIVWV